MFPRLIVSKMILFAIMQNKESQLLGETQGDDCR